LVQVDGRAACTPLFGGACSDMYTYFLRRLTNQAVPSCTRLDPQRSSNILGNSDIASAGPELVPRPPPGVQRHPASREFFLSQAQGRIEIHLALPISRRARDGN
jgi:hypothetical protein